ncbi:class I SAM-dependent methyltransferase [Paraburkholderia sp.]|uniref:class I SAM-dependent methyltransferase n=1 Tax=Paraburkholderia sp. TaxID=1926495 RepID=UPI003D6FE0AD
MNVPDTPHMDEGGLAAFTEHIEGIDTYLEYGCGGSTVFAARSGVKNLIAVDTSSAWIDAVREGTQQYGTHVRLVHCDLGEVGAWGRPVDDARIADYHRYAVMPWEAAKESGLVPQLVLIDGRFRVASFLYTLICARPGTTILFDDYLDRPEYHVVEQFCGMKEAHGRMGIFIANQQFQFADLAQAFARYSIVVD